MKNEYINIIENIQPLTEMNITNNQITKVQNNLGSIQSQKNNMGLERSSSSQDSLYEKFKNALETLHENNIIHNNIKLENLGLRKGEPIFLNFEFSRIFGDNIPIKTIYSDKEKLADVLRNHTEIYNIRMQYIKTYGPIAHENKWN